MLGKTSARHRRRWIHQGSHLVQTLKAAGAYVPAFVYYNNFNRSGDGSTPSPKGLEGVDVFSGDVRDPNGVATAMEGCEVVFHLAALIAIPYSYHSPDSYVDAAITRHLSDDAGDAPGRRARAGHIDERVYRDGHDEVARHRRA